MKTLLDQALEIDRFVNKNAPKIRTLNGVNFPFIAHPLEVMKELILAGEKDEEILAAAILHDTVEDCEDRVEARARIKALLGERVLSIVDELTLPIECADGGSPTYNKNLKYEHIANLLNNGSIEAIRVKLADRYRNINDMNLNSEYRRASKYADQFIACVGDGFFNKINGDLISERLWGEIVARQSGL